LQASRASSFVCPNYLQPRCHTGDIRGTDIQRSEKKQLPK
jgi:hypothetical protein